MALRGAFVRRAAARSAGARGFASEKDIAMRINATKNIQKITASMKMVSQAKLNQQKRRLAEGRPFAAYLSSIMPAAEESTAEEQTFEMLDASKTPLFVPITSEQGFCGGVNSVHTKVLKIIMGKCAEEGKEPSIMVVGNKGRSQLRRLYEDKIPAYCIDVGRPLTFAGASALATEALKTPADSVFVMYNIFVSAIAYQPTIQPVLSLTGGEEEAMVEYEFEPDTKSEILTDLHEYNLASAIYSCYEDAATAEISSRVQAMENASKNAGELIDALTLLYNRTRQARITTELIEIISGASALE